MEVGAYSESLDFRTNITEKGFSEFLKVRPLVGDIGEAGEEREEGVELYDRLMKLKEEYKEGR